MNTAAKVMTLDGSFGASNIKRSVALLKKVKGPKIKDLSFNSWYLLHSDNVKMIEIIEGN